MLLKILFFINNHFALLCFTFHVNVHIHVLVFGLSKLTQMFSFWEHLSLLKVGVIMTFLKWKNLTEVLFLWCLQIIVDIPMDWPLWPESKATVVGHFYANLDCDQNFSVTVQLVTVWAGGVLARNVLLRGQWGSRDCR